MASLGNALLTTGPGFPDQAPGPSSLQPSADCRPAREVCARRCQRFEHTALSSNGAAILAPRDGDWPEEAPFVWFPTAHGIHELSRNLRTEHKVFSA